MKIHVLDLCFLGEKKSIAAFLLESGGELALVEAGPASTFENLKKAIAEKGFDAAQVKHVFLTHIHFDHAGAAWLFAKNFGSKIYVHPAGSRHLVDPTKLYNSAKMIYGDQMEPLWGTMEGIDAGLIVEPKNGQKFKLGRASIRAWHTPGHAVHHIAWQVGQRLFAGDVAGCRIGRGPVVPPCPPPDIDVEAWLESIDLMRKLPVEKLILTHFGPFPDKTAHLEELENRLKNWAEWMRPHFEAQTPQREIVPLFEKFVRKELAENGVSRAAQKKYAAANPPFMSVAGLLRYWSKKGAQST